MENLLNKQSVQITRCVVDSREECGVSGEYSLPDYCPDMASILKCMATPSVQSRHWSGDQLMVDGMALFRVLYLDEDRCRVHSAEFSQPFSCTFKTNGSNIPGMLSLDLTVKYVNCRALSPRRIEARCGVCIHAYAECAESCDFVSACEGTGLMSRSETAEISVPVGFAEKILTVSEAFDFPQSLPGAEMLLGGDCRADVQECKLLNGKAIVKGTIYIHQLYTDNISEGTTHCLDFALPYSQILDLEGCTEGMPYDVRGTVLTDTERCAAGPDGDNSVLEVAVKLLIQCQIYRVDRVPFLLDAYHTDYPTSISKTTMNLSAYLGCSPFQTVLPMLMELPEIAVRELLDVWVVPQDHTAEVRQESCIVTGHLNVCMLLRDEEGQIVYFERSEEYQVEQSCRGNRGEADVSVGELRYRVVDGKLELQVTLSIYLRSYMDCAQKVVQELHLKTEEPYPKRKAGVLMYYAQAGESIWDIGCHCHADAQMICDENDLSIDTIIRPTLLVVPTA